MMRAKILTTLLFLAFVTLGVSAQDTSQEDKKLTRKEKREKMKAKFDSVLAARYNKVNYDTMYIGRPKTKLTMKIRANVSGNEVYSKGTYQGQEAKADLKTDVKATLSIGLSYQGISAGLAINPSSLSGKNKDYELNVNFYSNRLCLDASYQTAKTLSGEIVIGDVTQTIEKGIFETKSLNVSGYYIFNHRRFSYPAAFTQSYVQKRSAGSWLAGFSFQGGKIKTTDKVDVDECLDVGHLAIGGGYGYNLVVKKKWLFHASCMPTLVILGRNSITINDEKQKLKTYFPDILLNGHLAVIYNFSDKLFWGTTMVMDTAMMSSSERNTRQSKWRVRTYLGIRF